MTEQYHCYSVSPLSQSELEAAMVCGESTSDAAERYGLDLDAADGQTPGERVVMVRRYWLREVWHRITIRPVRRYRADLCYECDGEQAREGGE